MKNSTDWEVARTIYSTLTLRSKIVIERFENGVAELMFKFTKAEFTRMDFVTGHPDDQLNQQIVKPVDEDEEEDDDDDFGFGQNLGVGNVEGGMIMALLNMQLSNFGRNYYPEFKVNFTNNVT